MENVKDWIKNKYDKRHPVLYQLRKNQGMHIDEVEDLMREYARQIVEFTLQKAADGAFIEIVQGYCVDYDDRVEVNRDSILSLQEEIIKQLEL